MSISCLHVGIDISKNWLDVYDPRTGFSRIENTATAIAAVVSQWHLAGCFAVFEATGSYDRALRCGLEAAGVAFVRLNPERSRDFARAIGKRAKTDRVDARMLSEYGRRMAPSADATRDKARENVAACHKRRDQLVAMRAQEAVRASECQDKSMAEGIGHHIEWLDGEIIRLEAQTRRCIEDSSDLREARDRLRCVPGIGPVAATTLIALMPELGQRSPKAIAALAGLAPYNNDSGRRTGQRAIRGGRQRVRKALYMAALSAARSKTKLGAFFKSLREQNKPPKLALIALARKIIVILNAIMRDKSQFKRT
jgi:transposase